MAYDGWIEYNGTELINTSRTAQLAEALGIDTVWVMPDEVEWIETALGGSGYDMVQNAPWYDPGYPASAEFAGILSLGFTGLDDSTLTSTPVEYITDGGHSGKARNATLSIVGNVAIIAATDRGAEFGKRWLDRVLRDNGERVFCTGADLRYFRWADSDAPIVHRRDTRLTRGTSVTRKRKSDCSATWLVTLTLTAADPYEYGDPVEQITEMGVTDTGYVATGPKVATSGTVVLTEESCPVFDYNPIFDPLYPALVQPPTAPDFYPDGWSLPAGATFERAWARLHATEPSGLVVVPVVTLSSLTEARMVRVSIWPAESDFNDQCDPLWQAIITYMPPNMQFVIDGEQKVSYVWDGASPLVRRADSLVYGRDATPIEWVGFTPEENLLVTLDLFTVGSDIQGSGDVRMALDFVPKSD